jgi:hypothetical protein
LTSFYNLDMFLTSYNKFMLVKYWPSQQSGKSRFQNFIASVGDV